MTHSRLLPSSLLLFLLVLLSVATRFTSASVGLAESSCTNFTFPEDGGVRELCYSIQVLGPSITMTQLPNGTEVTEYVGESSETYIFERDLEGIVTEIKWDEAVSLVDCVATVSHDGVGADDTMECKSCALCNDQGITSVSADCTNLEQGRNVQCGENAILYNNLDSLEKIPFFPFVQALEHTVSEGSPSSNTAPAPAPSSSSAAVSSFLPTGKWSVAAAATGGASAIIIMMLAL